MNNRQQVLSFLDTLKIPYQLYQHPAAYTMQDIEDFGVSQNGHVCKNLFLRDGPGKRHFLVSVCGDKHVDLKQLGQVLNTRLSFASEERLAKHLHLKKGEVTPLAALLNTDNKVEVFLDADLAKFEKVGVHPADNTATVFLSFANLEKAVHATGNHVTVVSIS